MYPFRKIYPAPVRSVFKAEFERRLYDLYLEIQNYYLTGNDGNIMPYLFKLFSYKWCFNPRKSK